MGAVTFNGKFLTASPTGVHRVAAELLRALDELRLEQSEYPTGWRLLTPRGRRVDLPLATVQTEARGITTWQPWEQLELPLLARGSLLVSLCNLAPLSFKRQIVMMHDAQVFSSPGSYSAKFRAWYRFAQPRLGRSSLAILTVSEFSKSQLLSYGVVDREEKIVVIPNGVDHLPPPANSAPGAPTRSRPFVLGLANTQAHKNVGLLLRAFQDPRLADLDLVLVGKAGRADFESLGLPAPPNVVFAGVVSDAELQRLYAAALCLAFPSTTEGFGLPPLEAMVAGCPALVAPCGALPEVCGDAALYAAADDPDAWAETLATLKDDDGERRRLSERGRAQAAQFTWRRSAERLMDVLDAVS